MLLDPLKFPLHGVRLIEASAGTGKTYMIAALYLRLVLGHGGANGFGRPLMPPEILVVTFTNAATEELRDRIRGRLAQAAAFFREQSDGDNYLQDLRAQYPQDTWPAHARLLDQAAQWMDQSAIHTIHSWCQRMLHQHAFDSGSLFNLDLTPDEQELLEEAACDYWRCFMYPQPVPILTDLLEQGAGHTPQELLLRVRPLLAVRANHPDCGLDATRDPFVLVDMRRQAMETARQAWAADFATAVEQIRQARAAKALNGNKYRDAYLQTWLGQLSDWVHHNGPLPEEKARFRLSSAGLKDGAAKNRSVPQHPAYTAFDRLNEQLAELDIGSALLQHAADHIRQRLRREKQRRSQMGFDDLLTRLHDALRNKQLAHVIAGQFPVALIDEFQDTDPVQYAIFRRIYRDRAGTGLLMIGDPKQAIYAFRGADLHTYLAARGDTAGDPFTLGTNYRSGSGMVQAVNTMFQAAADFPDGPFLFKDQIPFHPVSANGRAERLVIAGEPMDGMIVWQMAQDGPVNKTGDDGYLVGMAEAAATEMVRLLNLGGQQPAQAGFQESGGPVRDLRPADIAVLVRDGQEAAVMRRALDARRVRSVYLSDRDSVFDSPEAEALLFLLRACAEPDQESLVKAALASTVLELSLDRLERLNRDETAWDAELARFRRYQGMWQRQGVLPMLRAMLHEFGVPERLMPMPDGERRLTNLLHLAELLQAAAIRIDGEHGLIRWLAEQIESRGSGSEDYLVRLESDAELVRVVTIHKSKGLEYPLVFLPFICTCRPVVDRKGVVVTYHDEQGRLKLVQKPDPADIAAAENERLAEDLRLLYVAVTRARHACWLGVGAIRQPRTKSDVNMLHLSGLGYLMSAGQGIDCGQLGAKLTVLKGDSPHIAILPLPKADPTEYQPPGDRVDLEPAAAFAGHVSRDWSISSYSGILTGAQMATGGPSHADPVSPPGSADRFEPDSTAPDTALEDHLQEARGEIQAITQAPGNVRSIHLFPRGPYPGTFLHGLLEWAAQEGFGDLAADRGRIEDRIHALCRRRHWHDWVEVLTDWFHRLLQTPLQLPEGRGRIALAGLVAAQYQPELEFLFAAHQVNTRVLDSAVCSAVLPAAERPQLRQSRLNGMLKGFIDLVFCHEGRYYVIDYKSNYLGENEGAYEAAAMAQAMLGHRYDLQYVLYTLALHRLLKARLGNYTYTRDVGGVMYLFLRGIHTAGHGVYTDKPPRELIEKLDDCFAGREGPNAA